jgi:hypothetical protein
MRQEKVKFGIYLPKEIYAELYRRQLPEHFSFLIACLLEEFFKRADLSISREEMPTRAEQREYLKRKVREFFSQTGLSAKVPKPPVQEKTEATYVQEPSKKEDFTPANSKPVQHQSPPPPEEDRDLDLDDDLLKRIESLW